MKYYSQVNGNEYEIDIEADQVLINGEEIAANLIESGVPGLYSFLLAGKSHEALIESDRANYAITLRGEQFQVHVEDERTRKFNAGRSAPAAADGGQSIKAPIPGLIVKVLVEEGEQVEIGQPVVLLEAMKMENEIRTGRAGVITKIAVSEGERAEQGATLILIE